MTSLQTSITYGDAETRGQLRLWKQRLAARYTTFDRAYSDKDRLTSVVVDMVKGSRAVRREAVGKLTKAFGPGVTLESAQFDKRGKSVATWSILKPRAAVTLAAAANASESERMSLAQDCVTVNYIVAGCVNGLVVAGEGLWTLEVPDHALGRAVERSRFLTPEAIIREAHANLLDLPVSATKSQPLYLKAGPGCFIGKLVLGDDVAVGASTHVRVKTWLADDMLGDDQQPMCGKGEPGKRLGDTIFLPRPLWPLGGGPRQL